MCFKSDAKLHNVFFINCFKLRKSRWIFPQYYLRYWHPAGSCRTMIEKQSIHNKLYKSHTKIYSKLSMSSVIPHSSNAKLDACQGRLRLPLNALYSWCETNEQQLIVADKTHRCWYLLVVSWRHAIPADTWRNNNDIITSKWRLDVVLT